MKLDLFLANLFNPAILFFILGFLIKAFKSKISLSKGVSQFLSIYLVIAIGFKGGASLLAGNHSGWEFIFAAGLGLALGFALPFIAYTVLKKISGIDEKTQAAIAAHYGSVSLVTFITASAFLSLQQIPYAGYLTGVLALMESPAIFSGLIIAHRGNKKHASLKELIKAITHEIRSDGILLLLIGSFVVGAICGQGGLTKLSGLLETPFYGILSLFLLDMGMKVGNQLQHLKQINLKLILFGCYMPLLGASITLLCCKLLGFDLGTTVLMMVLGASASYIAVPAVMQIALPDAKAAIYLPMSLAVTFPFNVLVGIPVYYKLAQLVLTL